MGSTKWCEYCFRFRLQSRWSTINIIHRRTFGDCKIRCSYDGVVRWKLHPPVLCIPPANKRVEEIVARQHLLYFSHFNTWRRHTGKRKTKAKYLSFVCIFQLHSYCTLATTKAPSDAFAANPAEGWRTGVVHVWIPVAFIVIFQTIVNEHRKCQARRNHHLRWMGGWMEWNEDERFYIAQNSSETFDCYVKCRKFLLNNRKKIIENCFAKIKKNSGAEETWKGQELYKAQGLWAREITQRSDSTKM